MIEKGLLARLGEADSAHPPALEETAALRGDAHGSVAGGGGAARGTLVGGGELQRPGPAQAEDGVAAAAYRPFSGKPAAACRTARSLWARPRFLRNPLPTHEQGP